MAKSKAVTKIDRPLKEYLVYDSSVSRQRGRTTRILELARVVALTHRKKVWVLSPSESMARSLQSKIERLGEDAPEDIEAISVAKFRVLPRLNDLVMSDHTVAEHLLRQDFPDWPWLDPREDFRAFETMQVDERRIVEPV